MKVYEYRIVKIEKGLFLIEYKTTPYGVWYEVEDKKFKTKECWQEMQKHQPFGIITNKEIIRVKVFGLLFLILANQ